jgi:ABC-type dipeptide/oligopeptide/nickel transport system permease component
MAAFVVRRFLQGIIVVALVATIVFLLTHAAPGDPISDAMDNPSVTDSVRQSVRHAYGLDRPLPEQYARYVTNVFRGELGFSFSLKRPVADALADALPNTLLLMALGLAGGFALGITVATRSCAVSRWPFSRFRISGLLFCSLSRLATGFRSFLLGER